MTNTNKYKLSIYQVESIVRQLNSLTDFHDGTWIWEESNIGHIVSNSQLKISIELEKLPAKGSEDFIKVLATTSERSFDFVFPPLERFTLPEAQVSAIALEYKQSLPLVEHQVKWDYSKDRPYEKVAKGIYEASVVNSGGYFQCAAYQAQKLYQQNLGEFEQLAIDLSSRCIVNHHTTDQDNIYFRKGISQEVVGKIENRNHTGNVNLHLYGISSEKALRIAEILG